MSPLDADILDFIARHIESAAALELLLLLRRSPDTFWAPPAVAERLGISADSAASIAGRLHASGLLARAAGSSAFRFSPRDSADAQRLDTISSIYPKAPTAVLEAIRSRGRSASQPTGDDVRA